MVIHIEADGRVVPLDCKHVEVVRELLAGRQAICAGQGAVARVTWPVHRAVNLSWFVTDILHDVDFSTSRPARTLVVATQQPKGRPGSLPLRNLDTSFESTVFLFEFTLRLKAAGRVLARDAV